MTATFEQTSIASLDFSSYCSEILACYDKGAKVPLSILEKLFCRLSSSKLCSKKNFHLFLRNFLALILLKKSNKSSINLDELFYFMQQKAISHSPSLYQAYLPLLQHLLDKKDARSSLLLAYDRQRLLSMPSFCAEIGVLLFLEGTISRLDDCIKQGIEIACSQLEYLDANNDVFKGAMRQEAQSTDAELYSLYSLLFSLASFFLPEDQHMAQASKSFASKLESLDIANQEQTLLFSLLRLYFQNQLSLSTDLAEKKFERPLLPFFKGTSSHVKYLSKTTAALCSAKGDGLGFAFMKKHQVEFLSIGPQQGSIGEMSTYGTFSSFYEEAGPEILRIESSSKGFYFNTWLKCSETAHETLSKNWLHVCAICENEGLDITVKSMNLIEEQELHLLFFVKADKVIVDQTFHLCPHTLDRYEGKVAPLQFFKQQQPVVLESSLNSIMKVIPLSGEDHFWGAEFLVAYTLPQEESVSFKID